MDRNTRTPGFVRHYKPAPPVVWFATLVLLGAGAAALAVVMLLG